ncbi:prestalk protein [Biomphalaria pfeifferi]|uniref:Prestalk protein n=1 Tax=Biomphalaria pfeifferi TaxID=112525 RepID=A0AAD8BM16_BIOPF|nr:prestalk protein [Biomphalaria pfeifferi]
MSVFKISVCIILHLTFVNCQLALTTKVATCTDGAVQAGNSFMPHETYCEAFYHCNSGLNMFQRSCAYGTLYHPDLFTCVVPGQAVCNNWECNSGRVGRNYPSLCCDQFYTCTGSGFVKQSCRSGYKFDQLKGVCVPGSCIDQPNCVRFGTTNDPLYKCYDVPNSNPCKYDTVSNGVVVRDRPCPHGTAFNATLCQCSIFASYCPNGVNYLDNKTPDVSCRASVTLDFNTYPIVASSEKLGLAKLDYYFQTDGVSVLGGRGIFSTDPVTRNPSYLYNYFLNANQLRSPFALSVVFRWTKPLNGQTITLLTNDFFPRVCVPTFEVTVSYNNGVYTVNLYTVAVDELTKNRLAGSTQASIALAVDNFLETLVLFDGTLSGQLIDRGPSGLSTAVTNKVLIPTTQRLGDFVATNKCGLMLGKGLNGAIEKFQIREGCLDFSKVRA